MQHKLWPICWEIQRYPALRKPCQIAASVKKEEFPLLNLLRNKRLTEKVNCKSYQFRKWGLFNSIFKKIYSQNVPGIKMENLTPLTISCHCITVSIAWILSSQKWGNLCIHMFLGRFYTVFFPLQPQDSWLRSPGKGSLVLPFHWFFFILMKHHETPKGIWRGELWMTPVIQSSSDLVPFMSGQKAQLLHCCWRSKQHRCGFCLPCNWIQML